MDLRATLKSWWRRPIDYLGREWNRMAPRERRLVAGLVAAVGAFAVLVTGFLIVESLRDIAEANDDAREALAAIAKHRDEYLDAKARMVAQEVRIGGEPPQLAADLEAAAREAGVQLAEQTERPSVGAGRRYVEHHFDVKLRQVDLHALAKFLAKVETGRRLIVISRLNIRRRFSDGEKFEVDLTATAYERVKDDRPKRRVGTPTGRGTKT